MRKPWLLPLLIVLCAAGLAIDLLMIVGGLMLLSQIIKALGGLS